MWEGTAVVPHSNCNWEPVELRILKKELANLECNCNACETYREPFQLKEEIYQNDAAVQVERLTGPLDKYLYSEGQSPPKCERGQNINNILEFVRDDMYCPNCFLIWKLLRGFTRTLKDEESETKPDMFCADKSTGKAVGFIDSATSVMNVPVHRVPSSVALCDSVTDISSNTSMYSRERTKSNHDKVKFIDVCSSCKKCTNEPELMPGNCFCMENFINSIRPPL